MKKFVLTAMAFAVALSHGAERYKDRMFEVGVEKDVVYAMNVKHLAAYNSVTQLMLLNQGLRDPDASVVYLFDNETDLQEISLHMDVYTPKGDTATKRAAVVVLHGGAFAAGSKSDVAQHTVTYCDSLAARGFVTASVQYRLGITAKVKDKALTVDSLDFTRTVYRGIQDVRAAIRFLRVNADQYGIDPGRIYLVGNSAGAILTLENIYMDKDSEIPAAAKRDPDLGGLDENGFKVMSPHANAAVALWGAVHDIGIIEDVKKPVLLVHGKADSTVLFKTGRPLGNIANTLANVMPSSAATLSSFVFHVNTPTLYGSYAIDSALTAKNVEHETYFVDGMPHEFYDEPEYTQKVQDKVFAFLYSMTLKPADTDRIVVALVKPSLIRMGAENHSFSVEADRQYAVVDLRGRVVMNGMATAGESVDLTTLERGVYVLRVRGERPIRFGLSK